MFAHLDQQQRLTDETRNSSPPQCQRAMLDVLVGAESRSLGSLSSPGVGRDCNPFAQRNMKCNVLFALFGVLFGIEIYQLFGGIRPEF
jgi:hypothetical protein